MDLWEQRNQHLGPWPAARLPVALLPLRLETRYDRSGTEPLLRVRAYPDELHLDSHEPGLTDAEQRWGRHYWEEHWTTGAEASRARAAWTQLTGRLGPGRAAWVRRALTPENLDQAGSGETPRFPQVKGREAAWTRAPYTRVLPDRLAVLGFRGGQRVLCAFGGPIPDSLPVGPDPNSPPPLAEDEILPADPGFKWLVDFAEAEARGMALTIPITAEDLAEGFDTLLVLGLKTRDDGAERLEELLTAQHYTDGLAFVPQATPSNNTPGAASGYASRDPGGEKSFRAETGGKEVRGDGDANGAVLAAALGLNAGVFEGVAHAADQEQTDARHMQGALWATTWGYYLEQMLAQDIPDQMLEDCRRHYIDHVRARGPLPALRIGRQPYGWLPVLPLDNPAKASGLQAALAPLLRRTRDMWREAAAAVPCLSRGESSENQADRLMRVLSMGAVSDEFRARPALSAAVFGDPSVSGFDPLLPPALAERLGAVRETLGELGRSETDPVANLALADHAFPLSLPLVQEGSLSDTEPPAPNYLRWLRTADYTAIEKEDFKDLPGAEGGVHNLLFSLLRHSVLLEYARAALRIYQEKETVETGDGRDTALVDITETETFTLGRAMDRSVDPFGKFRDILHKLTAKDHPALARLDELRADLQYLETLPTVRLRWLLPEVLDLASHRLDAWLTANAGRRLAELRAGRPVGLNLGGYGVVQDLRPKPEPEPVASPPPEEEGPLHLAGDDNAGYLHAPSLPQAAAGAVLRSGYLAHRDEGDGHPLALDLSSARVRLAQWLLDGVRQGQSLGALLGYRFERGLTGRGLARYLEAFRKLAPLGEYYKLEAEKIARIDAEVAALKQQHDMGEALVQGVLDGLQSELDALIDRLNDKVSARSSLQSQVTGLNRQITTKQSQVAKLTKVRDNWQKKVNALRKKHPPTSEELMEAIAQLAGANLDLNKAKKSLASLTSKRDSKQAQINKLTNEINTLKSQRTSRQNQLTRKKQEFENLKRQNREAREAVPGRIQADMQKQFDDLLRHFREHYLYPPTTDIQAMETVAAQRVADGMILLEKHRAGQIPWGKHGLPPVEGPDRREVESELTLLESTLDAVGDAVTAESLFQTLQGNAMRAGATLDAVAGGETQPPELEFIRTPRSGVAATHRLMVLFGGDPAPARGWPSAARQARGAAEPRLNGWAAGLLGDPARVRLRGELFDPADGTVRSAVEATLAELGLGPLDVVFGIRGDDGGEVTERVRYHLRRTAQGGEGDELRLLTDREPDWGPEELCLAELVELARAAAAAITGSRALEPRDLQLPGEAVVIDENLTELSARAAVAASALASAHSALEALRAAPESADLESLRSTLLDLSHLGLPGAVPRSAAGAGAADRQILLEQAGEVAAEALRRLARLEELDAGHGEGRDHHLARLKAVFGKDFTVLPVIVPDAALPRAFAAGTELQGGDPLAAVTWLQQMARVRERSARLNDALAYAEALDSGVRLNLCPAQLPFAPGARWIALPDPVGAPPPTGRVSLVAHCPEGPPAGGPMAGLLVDEWVEVLPGQEETTGLAFHFDAPGTQPPQVALLAVPPDESRPWDLEDLVIAVLDTLELARLRAVDPDALAGVTGPADLLPAIYLARNPSGDTVSTDFTRTAATKGA